VLSLLPPRLYIGLLDLECDVSCCPRRTGGGDLESDLPRPCRVTRGGVIDGVLRRLLSLGLRRRRRWSIASLEELDAVSSPELSLPLSSSESDVSVSESDESEDDDPASSIARRCSMISRGAF
jgi:hypothetical protein